MLKELYIENLAVIEKACVTFQKGLTVFTGETGAGKSILIDAINLVLGQRSSKEIVRTGTKKALVTAMFSELSQATKEKLTEYGYESENDELLISREISAEGKSTARLMGKPVTVSILRDLGVELINIHGQHDNQILLSSDNHIDILDAYADYDEFVIPDAIPQTSVNLGTMDVPSHIEILDIYGQHANFLKEYQQEYELFVKLKRKYQKITIDEQEKARKIDLLTYQVAEISAIEPKPGEDEEIEEQLNLLRNAAQISERLSIAYSALYGFDEEAGGYDLLNTASDAVEEISDFNPEILKIGEQLNEIKYQIEETAGKISNFLEGFDFDKAALENLEQRREDLYQLKRKYGSTVEEILHYYENAKAELEGIQDSEQLQEALLEQINTQKTVVLKLGKQLSQMRHQAGAQFSKEVSKELKFLDMPNIVLKVEIQKSKYGSKGCDEVEFLFSTNKGETPKSIGKIASGGELSRIMLAIKSVLAEKDAIDTLIFDEIDTGVSGSSAQKIGLKLKAVADNHQVLCVTHSAQIAALAQNHFSIQKAVEGDRTYTRVNPLDTDGRIYEVARIMATDEITDLMLQNAKEMLKRGLTLSENRKNFS